MKKILVLLLMFSLFPLSVYSTTTDMNKYNADKFAVQSKKNKCNVCHVSSAGGGARNEFGQAYEAAGKKITSGLRDQFPELFDLSAASAPRIKRAKPNKLMAGVETKITIKGMNFAADSVLLLDGENVEDSLVFVSDKLLEVTLTLSEAGKHTLQVKNGEEASNLFKITVKAPKPE